MWMNETEIFKKTKGGNKTIDFHYCYVANRFPKKSKFWNMCIHLARKWPFMLPILCAMQTDGKAANS